jgi:GNAT superfamily N-acetyltransferase
MDTPPSQRTSAEITVAPLAEADLDAADRLMRLAFGAFIGLPDPLTFMGDAENVRTRWRMDPTAAFAATLDGQLAGISIAANWGSVGYFGPLAVDPALWDRGIGGTLLEPIMARFDAWGATFAGLCTFPNSPKHIGLYQKFGFWPRFLTANMSMTVAAPTAAPPALPTSSSPTRFSEVPPADRPTVLAACRDLTTSIYDGLDLRIEIEAIQAQHLGDTILLWDPRDDTRLLALATCHCGPGSEAGSGSCYIKFGAARPGPHAAEHFDALLTACAMLAVERNLAHLSAGVNTARHEAYQQMRARGFRADMHSIIMQRDGVPGYNRPGIYLIDDWR